MVTKKSKLVNRILRQGYSSWPGDGFESAYLSQARNMLLYPNWLPELYYSEFMQSTVQPAVLEIQVDDREELNRGGGGTTND